MSFFKTSYKCSLRFANVCFCVLPIKVTESTVRSITFFRLGGLFSFCASICSSAISKTADIVKLILLKYLMISDQPFFNWCNVSIFSCSSIWYSHTDTLLQSAEIFKRSKILFTTSWFFDSSEQYCIATLSNWLVMTGPNSSSIIFLIPELFAALFSLSIW